MHSAMTAACLLAVTISGHTGGVLGAGALKPAQQDPHHDWSALAASRGVTIAVEDLAGNSVAGTLLEVAAESLVLRVATKDQRIDRALIRRVTSTRRDSIRNGLLIGAVVGAGMAAGSSCYIGNRKCGRGARAAFVAFGAALWAVIASAIDR